jgi:REP element-mobilizing transposase RayT
MANTYTQINIHAVFAVKGRQNLLVDKFRNDLFRYIQGILKNQEQFALAVNGYKDHVHIFFELNPKYGISDIMRDVNECLIILKLKLKLFIQLSSKEMIVFLSSKLICKKP